MENIIRHHWISEAAYYNAEARRFAPGRELDDWLESENEYVKMEIARIFHEPSKDPAKWSDNIESDVIYRQMEVIGLH